MVKLANAVPWKRVIGEGALIVTSILLGLGIDAWWDGRGARRLEADLLSAVALEVADNRAMLRDEREDMQAQLELTDRFLRSSPADLEGVADSVEVWVQALARPLTFDPRSGASSTFSQATVLSREGIEARALVSEWLTRVADAEEEKASLWDRAIDVQRGLASYASAARRGRGNIALLTSLGGPSVLSRIRADTDLVEAVVLKSTAELVYLRQLDALGEILDSLASLVPAS